MNRIAAARKPLVFALAALLAAIAALCAAPAAAHADQDAYALLYRSGELVLQRGPGTDGTQGHTDSDLLYQWTGFEDRVFNSYEALPWAGNRAQVTSVTIRDALHPTSTRFWFHSLENAESFSGLEKLDMSHVTNTYGMFFGCSSVTSLDVSSFDMRNVTDAGYMFTDCANLTSLNVRGWRTDSLANMPGMFKGASALRTLDVSSFDTSHVTVMYDLFYGCQSLISLDLRNFDTSLVNNMNGMFYNCRALRSLNVSSFDTGLVTSMYYMFYHCESLTSLDVSSFDTGRVTDMDHMFYYCSSVPRLDVRHFDTSKVTAMASMFGNCKAAERIVVRTWDTQAVQDMSRMFYGCAALTSVTLTSFRTQAVQDMSFMFDGCASLTSLNLSHFDTGAVAGEGMADMFYGCSSLATLDLSSFDATGATTLDRFFEGCESLSRVKLGERFRFPNAESALPEPPSGAWLREGTSTELTGVDLAQRYDASLAGTWVWNAGTSAILYDSGELVVQVGVRPEAKRGAVVKTYGRLDDIDFTADPTLVPWYAERRKVTSVTIRGTRDVISTSYWFNDMINLKSVTGLAALDSTKLRTCSNMFADCIILASLDLGSFDCANITDMSSMFVNCTCLSTITLGQGWQFKSYTYLPRPTSGTWVRQGGQGSRYTPEALEQAWESSMAGTWVWYGEPVAGDGVTPEMFATYFRDVPVTYWGIQDLCYVFDRHLMTGSKGLFRPDANTTRGQVVTILFRHAFPDSTATTDDAANQVNTTPFADNLSGQYYTAAVNWAYEQGILTGKSDAVVDPGGLITRQQFAAMVYRYATLVLGLDAEGAGAEAFAGAPDADQVADYAVDGMGWCYTRGIMTGSGGEGGPLNPANNATRAHVAKMMATLLQQI